MSILRRLLDPLSTRLINWWCHLGVRTLHGGLIVVVTERELEDKRGR
jgi:hypothetical protein